MPAAVAVPLITAAVGAGATVAASRSARVAQRDAAAIEGKYTAEALRDAREQRAYEQRMAEEARLEERKRYADETSYTRGRYAEERDFDRADYADYRGRLSPYEGVGAQAVTGLGASTARALPGLVPTMGGGGMVKIQAPTGEVREVPQAHADHYVSLGGKVIA